MSEEVRILITGDRDWDDSDLIRAALSNLPKHAVVIDGAARGADSLAHEEAERLHLSTERYPAWWNCKAYEDDQGKPCKLDDGRHEAYHGRAAGVIRNQRMLEQSSPTEVWAFHDWLEKSSGTADMVKRGLKAKVMSTLFSHVYPDGVVL